MMIYGLYGKSGTGKSHKAMVVATRYNIDAVIDDGILIVDKVRVAGLSAKNEKLMHAATKRAIFHDERHREEVRKAIQARNIRRLLVIGTSQRMVRIIIDRLGLKPERIVWVPIEEIQSGEELQLARQRRSEGYHVIPIVPVAVKDTYSGWFRKIIIRFGKRKEEATLIKPAYGMKHDGKTGAVTGNADAAGNRLFLKRVYAHGHGGNVAIHPRAIEKIVVLFAGTEPKLNVHDVVVKPESVHVALSTVGVQPISVVEQWREALEKVLADQAGVPHGVKVEWRSVILKN